MDAHQLPLDLSPFAEQIISVAGRTVATKDLVFQSTEDSYSTCFFDIVSGTGQVTGQSAGLFSVGVGKIGQGSLVPLTLSQTNLQTNPYSGNDIYLATHIGFEWYMAVSKSDLTPVSHFIDVSLPGPSLPLTSYDIKALNEAFFWDFQVGAGPTRVRGNIGQYPYGAGIYTAGLALADNGLEVADTLYEQPPQNGGPNCAPRTLEGGPIVFPPTIQVNINVQQRRNVFIANDGMNEMVIALRCNLRGARMTLPV